MELRIFFRRLRLDGIISHSSLPACMKVSSKSGGHATQSPTNDNQAVLAIRGSVVCTTPFSWLTANRNAQRAGKIRDNSLGKGRGNVGLVDADINHLMVGKAIVLMYNRNATEDVAQIQRKI